MSGSSTERPRPQRAPTALMIQPDTIAPAATLVDPSVLDLPAPAPFTAAFVPPIKRKRDHSPISIDPALLALDASTTLPIPNLSITPPTPIQNPTVFRISHFLREADAKHSHPTLPTLVFCIPPTVSSAREFLEALPTPALASLGPSDRNCRLCRREFLLDAARASQNPAPNGVDFRNHEVPVRLACEHVLGSKCLARFLVTGPADSCPVCRRQLFELKQAGDGKGLDNGGKVRVLPLLLEYGRRSVEEGAVGGVEFNYGYVGASKILRMEVRGM